MIVINCKIQCISNLSSVRDTLVQLCLAEQCITQIQGLDLPNLRSLYLQNNKISKIQGLEECPRLQRLWLFGNQIQTIENIHCCPDLRELWLQVINNIRISFCLFLSFSLSLSL
jgi:Leucine-rich repeat (LRR) protein